MINVNSRVTFGFVLMPNFSLPELSGFLDLLRLAADDGDQSKQIRCSWTLVGETLETVIASCGVAVSPWETFDNAGSFDYVIVIGGTLKSGDRATPATIRYIQRVANTNATLVGMSTGVFCLMRAGVLSGCRVCVPWRYYWEFVKRYPNFDENALISDQLYVIDRRRITGSGGCASIDIAASILSRHMTAETVTKALHILMVGSSHKGNAPQPPAPGSSPVRSTHPKVRRAILLMEQHVGFPLSLDKLSQKLNMSSRTIERLFKAETGQGPQVYARLVRLRKAAELLEATDKSVAEIASSCGFADSSHFGREFRKQFALQPLTYREQRRAAPREVERYQLT